MELRGVRKTYGGRPVLKGCSVSFEAGRICVVVGPNGSGKSTLLRIASLLEEPDAGDVVYSENGRTLPKDISLRRRISVVLPGNTLFNDTVFNNVAYGLKVRGLRGRDVRERVEGILELLGLSGKAKRWAGELSSGEAQRVAIARALVVEPEFVFLDEPTASLDPKNTEVIERVIMERAKEKGVGVVMITHDIFQARRIADEVLFLVEGEVKAFVKAAEFFRLVGAKELIL